MGVTCRTTVVLLTTRGTRTTVVLMPLIRRVVVIPSKIVKVKVVSSPTWAELVKIVQDLDSQNNGRNNKVSKCKRSNVRSMVRKTRFANSKKISSASLVRLPGKIFQSKRVKENHSVCHKQQVPSGSILPLPIRCMKR